MVDWDKDSGFRQITDNFMIMDDFHNPQMYPDYNHKVQLCNFINNLDKKSLPYVKLLAFANGLYLLDRNVKKGMY